MLVVGLRVRAPFTVKQKGPSEKEQSTSRAQTNPTVDGRWRTVANCVVACIDAIIFLGLCVRLKMTHITYCIYVGRTYCVIFGVRIKSSSLIFG